MSDASRLIDILNKALAPHGRELFYARMFLRWPEVVGGTLAALSKPVRLRGNILVVAVKDQRWVMELGYAQAKIIEKYRVLFPRVEVGRLHCVYKPGDVYGASEPKEESRSAFPSERGPMEKLDIPWRLQDEPLASSLDRFSWACCWAEERVRDGLDSYPQDRFVRGVGKSRATNFREVLESRHPTFGVRSDFLTQKDNFQPFGLYL